MFQYYISKSSIGYCKIGITDKQGEKISWNLKI